MQGPSWTFYLYKGNLVITSIGTFFSTFPGHFWKHLECGLPNAQKVYVTALQSQGASSYTGSKPCKAFVILFIKTRWHYFVSKKDLLAVNYITNKSENIIHNKLHWWSVPFVSRSWWISIFELPPSFFF